jgi:iron-sulfur cluster assembly accessory protein
MKITSTAYQQLKKIGCQLYLSLEPGGCEEYKYKFSLTAFGAEWEEYRFDEVRVLIPTSQLEKLGQIELDFESSLIRSGFVIRNNPAVKEKCRCGISVR